MRQWCAHPAKTVSDANGQMKDTVFPFLFCLANAAEPQKVQGRKTATEALINIVRFTGTHSEMGVRSPADSPRGGGGVTRQCKKGWEGLRGTSTTTTTQA